MWSPRVLWEGSALISALSKLPPRRPGLFHIEAERFSKGGFVIFLSKPLQTGALTARASLCALLYHILCFFCSLFLRFSATLIPDSSPRFKPSAPLAFKRVSWGDLFRAASYRWDTNPAGDSDDKQPRSLLTALGGKRSRFCCQELPERCWASLLQPGPGTTWIWQQGGWRRGLSALLHPMSFWSPVGMRGDTFKTHLETFLSVSELSGLEFFATGYFSLI